MRLTTLQARRIALGAQGFTRQRGHGDVPEDVTARHLARTISRLGVFQIDSVNVLQRAHYLPLYSRCGPYDPDLLHRAAGRAPRRLFEYWAHEAALVDVALWPAMQFRMQDTTRMWGGPRDVARDHPEFVAWVLDEVRRIGPVTAREIEHDAPREKGHWGWNWSQVKQALEYLFYVGEVTAARRNAQFERVYDLTERVIPPSVLAAPALDRDEAHLVLVEHAARALGVATEPDLRDYFRLGPSGSQAAVATLVQRGDLVPVDVMGRRQQSYLHRDATTPRLVSARSLLSPFDPLVFERTRTAALFGFRYRIEIYVPAEQRVHGYYVLPFLLGDRLVGRVDLKADRAAGTLVVHAAFAEPDAPASTAVELAAELRLMAGWLGLSDVRPPARGDLAEALTAALS